MAKDDDDDYQTILRNTLEIGAVIQKSRLSSVIIVYRNDTAPDLIEGRLQKFLTRRQLKMV